MELENLILSLLPAETGLTAGLALVAASYVTSAFTAALGLGGGLMMLAAMASLLPPLAVIPVHALVQLGSNSGRAVVMRKDIDWKLLGFFAIGSVVGIGLAMQVVVALPTEALRIVLAAFIIWAVWGPKPKKMLIKDAAFIIVGAFGSFVTMFVGATGPLVAAFLSPDRLGRHGMVANQGSCMTVQHGLKIVAFGILGFAFVEWIPLVLAMVATGFVGTLTGKAILDRMPEKAFRIGFKALLTLLSLRLAYLGVMDLIA